MMKRIFFLLLAVKAVVLMASNSESNGDVPNIEELRLSVAAEAVAVLASHESGGAPVETVADGVISSEEGGSDDDDSPHQSMPRPIPMRRVTRRSRSSEPRRPLQSPPPFNPASEHLTPPLTNFRDLEQSIMRREFPAPVITQLSDSSDDDVARDNVAVGDQIRQRRTKRSQRGGAMRTGLAEDSSDSEGSDSELPQFTGEPSLPFPAVSQPSAPSAAD